MRLQIALMMLLCLAGTGRAPVLSADEIPQSGSLELETTHFRFLYEAQDQPGAFRLAAMAEDVYDKVTSSLGRRPARVTVVVRGSGDLSNGYFIQAPDRIVLYLAPPTTTLISAYSEDYLRNLLTHELTHFVHMTEPVGLAGVLSSIFGPYLLTGNALFLPGWASEGLATVNEGLLASGGRSRNPFFEMTYKAPILEGRLWSFERSGYSPYQAPEGRHYAAGFLLVDHLRRHWGERAFVEVFHSFAFWPFDFGAALKKVTGLDPVDFYERAVKEWEQRYALDAVKASGRTVSPEGQWYLPRKTGKGWIGFGRGTSSPPGIHLWKDILGTPSSVEGTALLPSSLLVAVELSDPYSFSVTSDGEKILYSAYNVSSGPRSDLWLWQVGTGSVRLTGGGGYFQPALSPDGGTILSVQRQGSSHRLVVLRDNRFQSLYEPPGVLLQTPSFSPDGELIALVENHFGNQSLVILDRTGAVRERFFPGAAVYHPRWSGERRLILSTDLDGRLDLWEIDLATRSWRPLPQDPVGAVSGERDGPGLLYGGYSSWGWVVKFFETVGEEPWRPWPDLTPEAATPTPREATETASTDLSAFRPRSAFNFPWPYGWAPALWLSSDRGLPDLAAGATLMGRAFTESSEWTATGLYHPQSGQLSGSFSASWSAFGWLGSLFAAREVQGFLDPLVSQSAKAVLISSWAESDEPQWSQRLWFTLTAGWRQQNATSTLPAQEALRIMAGNLWTVAERARAPLAFFGGWSLISEAYIGFLPVQASRQPSWDTVLRVSTGVPLFGPIVLKGQLIGYAGGTGSLWLAPAGRSFIPRSSSQLAGDWRLHFSSDLQIPLGLAEIDGLGLANLREGLVFWLETGVQGRWESQVLWDQEFLLGAEFSGLFQIGQIRSVFHAGTAVSRRWQDPWRPVDPYRDWKIYLGLKTASSP